MKIRKAFDILLLANILRSELSGPLNEEEKQLCRSIVDYYSAMIRYADIQRVGEILNRIEPEFAENKDVVGECDSFCWLEMAVIKYCRAVEQENGTAIAKIGIWKKATSTIKKNHEVIKVYRNKIVAHNGIPEDEKWRPQISALMLVGEMPDGTNRRLAVTNKQSISSNFFHMMNEHCNQVSILLYDKLVQFHDQVVSRITLFDESLLDAVRVKDADFLALIENFSEALLPVRGVLALPSPPVSPRPLP